MATKSISSSSTGDGEACSGGVDSGPGVVAAAAVVTAAREEEDDDEARRNQSGA
jgi:hypothetical protein